jgi:hypothetical protein
MARKAFSTVALLPVLAGCDVRRVDLALPCTVTQLDYWEDGGSTGVVLRDAGGGEVRFCFDFGLETRARGRIFVGSTWHEDGRPVAPGSEAERRLMDGLRSWLDARYSRGEQRRLAGIGSLAEARDDEWAWRVLRAIEARERARGTEPVWKRALLMAVAALAAGGCLFAWHVYGGRRSRCPAP